MGLSVATTSDIYSLGAVFYELLTEQRAQTHRAVDSYRSGASGLPRPKCAGPALQRPRWTAISTTSS